MIVAIHQPEHLPWFGFIHKIAQVDKFVFLDNVQFKKNYFENRNKVVTTQGLQWLTVPVQMKGHLLKPFSEIEIEATQKWRKKYLRTLEQTYCKAPFYEDIKPIIKVVSEEKSGLLAPLNIQIIKMICTILSVETEFVSASQLNVSGNKSELLVRILKEVNATEYLMGKSGYDYIDLALFETAQIKIHDHEFNYPDYIPFNFKESFYPEKPSILDVIANLGAKRLSMILQNE